MERACARYADMSRVRVISRKMTVILACGVVSVKKSLVFGLPV
jgi:hypothetical protein